MKKLKSKQKKTPLLCSSMLTTSLFIPNYSFAECTPSGINDYSCSGTSNIGIDQEINSSSFGVLVNQNEGTTTINVNENIYSSSENGIIIFTTDPIEKKKDKSIIINLKENKEITAETVGINIASQGSGHISILSDGNIRTAKSDGIYINAEDGNKSVSVNQNSGSINAQESAIAIKSNGNGDISIISNGILNGKNTTGIYVNLTNKTSTATTKIEQKEDGNIYGKYTGISFKNEGIGGADFDIASSVSGELDSGLSIETNGDLNIKNTGEITGGQYGIYSTVSGNVVIESFNNIKGIQNNGIEIKLNNDNENKNLSISQEKGTISGTSGISATNNTLGMTTINNKAEIIGEVDSGITAFTNGDLSINNSGNIKGNGDSGISVQSSKNLIINNNGSIFGAKYGIYAQSNFGNSTLNINGSVKGNKSGIFSVNIVGIDNNINIFDSITSETEAAFQNFSMSENGKTNINLNKGAKIISGSNIAIQDLSSNPNHELNINLNDGSILHGSIKLGTATNNLTINNGADITNATEFDAGDSVTSTGALSGKSTLNLNQSIVGSSNNEISGKSGNILLNNWDEINVGNNKNSVTLSLTSDLVAKKININSDSILNLKGIDKSIIDGDTVENKGTIDLTNQTNGIFNTLTINNNYIGGNNMPTKDNPYPLGNGSLIVNTIWNNSDSVSDLLHIIGTVSGYTNVTAKDNIIGDIVRENSDKYSATVVTVDNHSIGSNSFYGFANTTGAGQAILVQKDANNYAWYLPATSDDPVTPVKPINPTVPGAVLMPKANLNAGYSILGTLHERVSEQQISAWYDCSTCQVQNNDGQVWGRFIGNYNKAEGKNQYDYRSKLWGLQFGYDFDVNYDENNNTRSHTGVMLTYVKDNVSFYNSKSVYFNTKIGNYAEKNRKTGHGQSDIYSLGAYHTYYYENGSYLDLVGLFNYIRNKYTTYGSSNDRNNAYGPVLSAEIGRPFAITNNGLHNGDWLIEPQAQLVYQYLTYSDYKTTNDISVEQHDQQGLRGRLGARLAYNQGNEELKIQTLYFTANLIHDFLNPKRTDFGTSAVNERNAKTAGEVGVGFQLPLAKTSYIYFDTRYYHSLGNSDGKTKEFSGTLGLKYFW